jgi:hypothetical protein
MESPAVIGLMTPASWLLLRGDQPLVDIHGTKPRMSLSFARNRLGHGRLCEKRSLTGVSFQSTPSIACGSEHRTGIWLTGNMSVFPAIALRRSLPATHLTRAPPWKNLNTAAAQEFRRGCP